MTLLQLGMIASDVDHLGAALNCEDFFYRFDAHPTLSLAPLPAQPPHAFMSDGRWKPHGSSKAVKARLDLGKWRTNRNVDILVFPLFYLLRR